MESTLDLRKLDEVNNNIYKAVIISAKRARQVHAKITDELKKKLGEIENEEDLDEETVDREKIVKEYDKKDKPSVIAINELYEGKIRDVSGEEETSPDTEIQAEPETKPLL